ncbi:MAG: hypothetical protein WC635_13510 [Bacteriovorax sp.]|jgi:hypothetical protein
MKLAIIGSGPLAIFCARHFDQLGAEVVLFQKNALGGNVRFLLDHFPEMEVSFENKMKNLKEFWEADLVPAIKFIEEKNIGKAGEVLRVHKRFLHPAEAIAGKSRLHDLFRVVFSVNPREAILKQLEENPEMFKQLGEQVVKSLHQPVESFEDFDIVIEARGYGRPARAMGPSNALALNENNIRNMAPLYYEKNIFSQFKFEGKNNLLVVGDTDSTLLALLKCKEWLFSRPNRTLSWITSAPAFKSRKHVWLNEQFNKLLDISQTQFDSDKIVFEQKMYEWRDLEDHIKAKIPKPLEPVAKISVYQGYDVTAVDRLLDRDGVYATIETPDFREFSPVPNDLKTLPADAILIACGVEENMEFSRGIKADEPGYYILESAELDNGINIIKNIEQKILSYFSRAQ